MDHAYVTSAAQPAPLPVGRDDRWENVRLFVMTFTAGFIAFYGLIA